MQYSQMQPNLSQELLSRVRINLQTSELGGYDWSSCEVLQPFEVSLLYVPSMTTQIREMVSSTLPAGPLVGNRHDSGIGRYTRLSEDMGVPASPSDSSNFHDVARAFRSQQALRKAKEVPTEPCLNVIRRCSKIASTSCS
jgi:hypothetical protein